MVRENEIPNTSTFQNKPINATMGGEQTETDYQASQDRPSNAVDFPVEGSRDEIEHSAITPPSKDAGPGAPIESVPAQPHPTVPAVEGDDRIEHQWRPSEKNEPTH